MEVKNNLKVTGFECGDLAKYTDSMMFNEDEKVCSFEAKNDDGVFVNIDIVVAGDVRVFYKDELYRCFGEFPDDLKAMFEDGTAYYSNEVNIDNNNWFEAVYTITDRDGNEIAYDGEVFESPLPDYTPEKLKDELLSWANDLVEYYITKEGREI